MTKLCTKCGESKPPSAFHLRAASLDGRQAWCVDCKRERQTGCTASEFSVRLAHQQGHCAICQLIPKKILRADHNHATGAIHGLLCDTCNRGIGYLQDDPAIIDSAARYLRAHQTQEVAV